VRKVGPTLTRPQGGSHLKNDPANSFRMSVPGSLTRREASLFIVGSGIGEGLGVLL